MQTFGERLRDLRTQKKISLEKLGQYFGVGKSATSSWEIGKSKPSSDDLVKLAEILDTTPNYLLLGGEEKNEIEALRRENELMKRALLAYERAEKAEMQLEETKNIAVFSE